MAEAFPLSSIEIGGIAGLLEAQPEPALLEMRPDREDPFRILILGDFTGRRTRWRKPVEVKRDSIDDVLAQLHVHLELKLGNEFPTTVQVRLESLEHFSPDSIFARCELFRGLAAAPTFTNSEKSMAASTAETGGPDVSRMSSGNSLDEILARAETEAARSSESHAHHASGEPIGTVVGAGMEEKNAAGDAGDQRNEQFSVLMRAILHHPTFQAIEAAWRSVAFLWNRLENDDRIRIYLFDISKEDLAADLLDSENFRASAIYQTVVADTLGTPDAEPWAVLVGNYGFDRNYNRDMHLLERMGLLARAAGAPFLAECAPSKWEGPRAIQYWKELRKSSHAGFLGLATPRVLLRVPYGADTCAVESFPFEEMPDRQHTDYLWGNPAFLCAQLLASDFLERGWEPAPGMKREVPNLPVHVYRRNGAPDIQPPAEIALNDHDCARLSKEGLMAVVAEKNKDAVRFAGIQSIADPPAPLSGRWII